jgi:hypothetical protein
MHQINKTLHLTQELLAEFNSSAQNQHLRLTCTFPNKGHLEGFHVTSSRGVTHIDAQSPLAAAYGISQLSVAIKSGYLGEFLGSSSPRFSLRPLWLGAGCEVAISTDIAIALPRFMSMPGQTTEQRDGTCAFFCRRLIELGYNAIVLGARESLQNPLQSATVRDVSDFISLVHAYGLKVIIKPALALDVVASQLLCSPVNSAYRKWIMDSFSSLWQLLPSIDYVFWESGLLHADFAKDPLAKDMLMLELVSAEVNLLEQALPAKTFLIYYLPVLDSVSAKQQAIWISLLCDEVGEHTTIAFSAVAGDCFEDHLMPHPFWEQLRTSPDASSTRLMPLVNIGMVSQGEGLWPSPALDLVEKYYSRLCRHHFAGVMALANMLPQQGSVLDCCLWVAGQSQWRSSSPAALAEMWFRTFRAEWDFFASEEIMKGARQLVVELSMLRSLTQEANRDSILSEDCRVVTESILARLKELLLRSEKLERKRLKRANVPSIFDYMQVFARDVQRIVLHFLQCFNLSYPHVLGSEELTDSFWMQLSPGAGQGIRSVAKVVFSKEPNSGPVGSRMEAIYRENRLM